MNTASDYNERMRDCERHQRKTRLGGLGLLIAVSLYIQFATAITTQAEGESQSYQLRLVVQLPSDSASALQALARFGRNPQTITLSGEEDGRCSLQAETATTGAAIYIMRGGIEQRHDLITWQAAAGSQTTVEVIYQSDMLGGLQFAGERQSAGFVTTVDVASSDPSAAADQGSDILNPAAANAPANNAATTATPISPGAAVPQLGISGGDSQPAGFVAAASTPISGSITTPPWAGGATSPTATVITPTTPPVSVQTTSTPAASSASIGSQAGTTSGGLSDDLSLMRGVAAIAAIIIVGLGVWGYRQKNRVGMTD